MSLQHLRQLLADAATTQEIVQVVAETAEKISAAPHHPPRLFSRSHNIMKQKPVDSIQVSAVVQYYDSSKRDRVGPTDVLVDTSNFSASLPIIVQITTKYV